MTSVSLSEMSVRIRCAQFLSRLWGMVYACFSSLEAIKTKKIVSVCVYCMAETNFKVILSPQENYFSGFVVF